MQDSSYGMVILDELNIVLRYEYLALAEILALFAARRKMLHILVTGWHASDDLIVAADLVTEFYPLKHPYQTSGYQKPKRRRVLMLVDGLPAPLHHAHRVPALFISAPASHGLRAGAGAGV